MAKKESAFKVIIALVLIAMFSAMLLAYVNQVTSGPIAANKKAETQKAIKLVLKGLENIKYPETPEQLNIDNSIVKYFKADFENGTLAGYAFVVKAPNGFTNDFDMMVGLDSVGKVIDTYVLDHRETPSLGDGMKEDKFKNQFIGRTIEDKKMLVKNDGGNIDGLTAATITSRAFTGGVKRALTAFAKLGEEKANENY
jgi:electron transport complex protein RnfG